LDKRGHFSWVSNRKEVNEIAKKENPSSCGCIGAKPSIHKTVKSLKEVQAKEVKNQKSKETKSN